MNDQFSILQKSQLEENFMAGVHNNPLTIKTNRLSRIFSNRMFMFRLGGNKGVYGLRSVAYTVNSLIWTLYRE